MRVGEAKQSRDAARPQADLLLAGGACASDGQSCHLQGADHGADPGKLVQAALVGGTLRLGRMSLFVLPVFFAGFAPALCQWIATAGNQLHLDPFFQLHAALSVSYRLLSFHAAVATLWIVASAAQIWLGIRKLGGGANADSLALMHRTLGYTLCFLGICVA
eukprot:SAG31_NODE_17390_length_672_cov_1.338569_1_plen_161_part_10